MAMGREGDRQDDLIVSWAEMPRSPGHVFYDRLQDVLIAGGFDLFVETACQPYYARRRRWRARRPVPPWRYFRMHMVGYFEGIASERGIAWRCSSSDVCCAISCGAGEPEKVPDHSWLSKTRGRLPHEVHERVFGWCCSASWPSKAWSRASGSASTPRLHGGQCRAAHDRAAGRWPDLSRNAEADGQGERYRHTECGRSGLWLDRARKAQEAVERRVDEQDRSRGQDCEDEGWSDAPWLYKPRAMQSISRYRRRRRWRHCVRPIKATTQRRSMGTLTTAVRDLALVSAAPTTDKPSANWSPTRDITREPC